MKSGVSSLNPYAASYIPLSKREAAGATSVTEKGFVNHDARNVWFQTQHIKEDLHRLDSSSSASKTTPEALQIKSKPACDSYRSSSQNVTEFTDNQFPDEDPDMDIEYLRMTFPGISEESLRDVYMVNRGDLDATIDMLTQLEFDGVESSGSLPETLDIGDVSESADSASLKLKNVAAEARTSSSPLVPGNDRE